MNLTCGRCLSDMPLSKGKSVQCTAPQGAATFESTFSGLEPNGTWSLYVFDNAASQFYPAHQPRVAVGIRRVHKKPAHKRERDTLTELHATVLISFSTSLAEPSSAALSFGKSVRTRSENGHFASSKPRNWGNTRCREAVTNPARLPSPSGNERSKKRVSESGFSR
jgi:hypothetical protein